MDIEKVYILLLNSNFVGIDISNILEIINLKPHFFHIFNALVVCGFPQHLKFIKVERINRFRGCKQWVK